MLNLGSICFGIFTPDLWGNDSQFDEHIFSDGWFNHQVALDPVCPQKTGFENQIVDKQSIWLHNSLLKKHHGVLGNLKCP